MTTWTARRVGGVETYLSNLLPELARLGHELALLHEAEGDIAREPILGAELASVPRWSVQSMGANAAIEALRRWNPDLIYGHGIHDVALEAATLRVAPGVFFAHNYYGTCISGAKTHKYPEPRPCSRRFGGPCLLHYFPHRCGGLSPITMVREFRIQRSRLKVLSGYDAIVTHSHHMYCEYAKHGIPPERLHRFVFYSPEQSNGNVAPGRTSDRTISLPVAQELPCRGRGDAAPWRLAFIGRMDLLKGGAILLNALPPVGDAIGRPLHVAFAGDGSERAKWEQNARRLQSRRNDIQIEFLGWLSRPQVQDLLDRTDLIVFPSVWPEPFGLVGPEAGRRGIPVAAFAVGGVRDWLIDGVNGYLAPGDPPTAAGLAHAIVECLRNPTVHERLSRGAVEMAGRFNRESHLDELMAVFAAAILARGAAAKANCA